MSELAFGCECCGKLDPLLETADGKALCLRCVEASPNAAGVDRDAIAALKMLTTLAALRNPGAN